MTKIAAVLLMWNMINPPPISPDFSFLLPELPDFFEKNCPGLNYPAIMSVYDPALGGRNCDGDCTTVATGLLEDWMYEKAGACPMELLGATVYIPGIDHSIQCVDTGGAIKAGWSERDNQCVVYFDTLWHLEREGVTITGAPYWTWWFIEDWSVAWEKE